MSEHNWGSKHDLVICNLYPFAEVVARGGEWSELLKTLILRPNDDQSSRNSMMLFAVLSIHQTILS